MKKQLLVVLLSLCSVCGYAQITAFRDTVSNGYNFWLYEPSSLKADSARRAPVIVFLHGSSLCGSDLNRVRRYGCIDAVEKGMDIDAVILAPQNPGGAWRPERVKNLLDWVQANYRTDTCRVYVVGMSLGGYGTMDFAGSYPERVTAAAALCGGTTLKNYDNLGRIPLWIMHGTADRAVSIKESQQVVDRLRERGDTTLLRFERMEGLGHGALARVFYLPQLYQWLFSHNKADSAGVRGRDYVIHAASLKEAYRSIDKNAVKPLVVDSKPPVAPAVPSSGEGKVHVVRQGDTLSAIARRYGMSVDSLCRMNNISAKGVLRIGQKIVVGRS